MFEAGCWTLICCSATSARRAIHERMMNKNTTNQSNIKYSEKKMRSCRSRHTMNNKHSNIEKAVHHLWYIFSKFKAIPNVTAWNHVAKKKSNRNLFAGFLPPSDSLSSLTFSSQLMALSLQLTSITSLSRPSDLIHSKTSICEVNEEGDGHTHTHTHTRWVPSEILKSMLSSCHS